MLLVVEVGMVVSQIECDLRTLLSLKFHWRGAK